MLEDPAVKSALAITLNKVRNNSVAQVAGKVLTPANIGRAAGATASMAAQPKYQPPGTEGVISPQGNPFRATNPYK